MAANPPPAPYRVPVVYRAARTRSWIKRGVVTHLAFYRRQSDESGLSIGDTPDAADRAVLEHFGIAQIPVAEIYALRLVDDEPPIRLSVSPDGDEHGNINKTLPFRDDPDPEKAGLAVAIAEALAGIATPTDHPPKPKAN